MIKLEEALKIIDHHCSTTMDAERVDLADALHRVLAEDVFADMDFPSFNKSAMDGYAIRREDIDKKLTVIEFIPAGKKPEKFIGPGNCAKIMTGAMMPEGADMVVMKEDVSTAGETIQIENKNEKGNILYQGEDVKTGDLILQKATLINAVHTGLLASVGVSRPLVVQQAVVSVLSTGDELVTPDEKPEAPKIRNSNSVQLVAAALQSGARAINFGQVADNKTKITEAVKKAMQQSDIVLLTGGASVGDLDFTAAVFEKLATNVHFTKLAIQPGKPVLFTTVGSKYLFGLSGNPVSSFVQFQLLVKPLINKLHGLKEEKIIRMPLGLSRSRKRAQRMLFFPVQFNEQLEAVPLEYHGSAHLNAYPLADGMACFPIGINHLKKGDLVDVRPI